MPFHRSIKAGPCSLLEPSDAAVIHRASICKCKVIILKIPLIIAPFFSSIFLIDVSGDTIIAIQTLTNLKKLLIAAQKSYFCKFLFLCQYCLKIVSTCSASLTNMSKNTENIKQIC